jgi:hypothetical protein
MAFADLSTLHIFVLITSCSNVSHKFSQNVTRAQREDMQASAGLMWSATTIATYSSTYSHGKLCRALLNCAERVRYLSIAINIVITNISQSAQVLLKSEN